MRDSDRNCVDCGNGCGKGAYILAPQVGLRSYDRLPFAYVIKGQAKP